MKKTNIFEEIAHKTTEFTGTTTATVIALSIILIWAISGPVFNFSTTWQLIINTGTTIVTFLMVFLIQRAQNKDSKAIHLKLNELIASIKGTSNRLIDIECSSEAELEILAKYYAELAELTKKEKSLFTSHSVEEASELQNDKMNEQKS